MFSLWVVPQLIMAGTVRTTRSKTFLICIVVTPEMAPAVSVLSSVVRETLCYSKIIETRKEVARKKNPTEHVGKDQRGFRVATANVRYVSARILSRPFSGAAFGCRPRKNMATKQVSGTNKYSLGTSYRTA